MNRYLGGELSGDLFERRLKVQGFGSVGEYAVTAIVPQIRVRYPLLDGKLTPYAVAGGRRPAPCRWGRSAPASSTSWPTASR